MAGGVHLGSRRSSHQDRSRVRAERGRDAGPFHDSHGRWHEPLLPLRPDVSDVPGAHGNVWHPGPQRWRLGPLRGSGEGPPDHGLGFLHLRPGLGASAAPDDLHRLVLHDHRPVALRRGLGLGDGEPDQVLAPGRQTAGRHARRVRPARLDALLPDVLQGFDPAGSRGRRGRYRPGRVRLPGAARGPPSVRDRGPGRPPQRSEDPRELAYEPAWFVREGHRVLPPPHAGYRQRSQRGRAARGCPPQDRQLARRAPRQARPHVGGGLP